MFNPKEWENLGQAKKFRGHRIKVFQYNTGKNAKFYLEAWGDPYARMRGLKPAPSVGRVINGRGQEAREEAIRQAKELASTGLYAYSE